MAIRLKYYRKIFFLVLSLIKKTFRSLPLWKALKTQILAFSERFWSLRQNNNDAEEVPCAHIIYAQGRASRLDFNVIFYTAHIWTAIKKHITTAIINNSRPLSRPGLKKTA
jgi:hypothetical protein